MTHLSLFSGIGGLDIAAEQAGFKTVAFVEREPFCQKVLRKHWPDVPIHDDVTTFNGRQYRGVTVLSGGFPCQDISSASANSAARGITGSKSGLFWEALRIIEECRPTWVVLENVYLLRTRGLDRVCSELERAGYGVAPIVLGAGNTAAPHMRRRFFVVGNSDCNGKPMPPINAETLRVQSVAGVRWGAFDSNRLRMDDGVSRRMDRRRMKALGNAVCPQQAAPLFQAIAQAIRGESGP